MLTAILATTAVSLVSLIGAFAISINIKAVKRASTILVALAAGTFLGDAFLHLLPESIELAEENGAEGLIWVFAAALAGVMVFFILESIIHWHHHIDSPAKNDTMHSLAVTNLIGDGLHNFLDGLAIAATFALSPELGLATTLAIILHEIPQEIADFGVLIHSGLSRSKALLFNLMSGLVALTGVAAYALLEDGFESIEAYLLAFVAGVFIYIAGTDLFPQIHQEKSWRKALAELIVVFVGIGLMAGLLALEL